jgi:HlyD family secretion protein
VYILQNTNAPGEKAVATLKPIRIKVGITDNVSTEVLDGLKEGDGVVTGTKTPQTQTASMPGGPSPFGGGGMRRF